MIIQRDVQPQIEKKLFQGKVIVVYGPRRVGKTTLVRAILEKFPVEDTRYLSCDEPDVRRALTDKTSTELISYLGKKKLIVLDEAQRVRNIGLTLKLLVDTAPTIQIIATGSSSFDLSNKIIEPLTGRTYEFFVYPFSASELSKHGSDIEENRLLETRLIYGTYPDVVTHPEIAADTIRRITRDYLYKDVLEYQRIKNPDVLEKLLQALALQIGNEVSTTELASLLGVDKKTISSYLRILEQSFVIFTRRPFVRNRRKELTKKCKVYFYDTGIRNALLGAYNTLDLRTDGGALWENYCMSERMKRNLKHDVWPNQFFWRTTDGQEVDLVEDWNGVISGYEIKWSKQNVRIPKAWRTNYPKATYTQIHRENYQDFVV